MNDTPFVPQKTLDEMNAAHPPGTRHAAMFKIGMSLLGQGFTRAAVFSQLRGSFDEEKTDKEIWDVIDWCEAKNPQPCGHGGVPMPLPQRPVNGRNGHSSPAAPPPTPEKIISGDFIAESDWFDRSPIRIPEDLADHAIAAFSALYAPQDRVNLVRRHFIGDDGKPKPHGPGQTLTRDEWLEWFKREGPPASEIGCWIRPNPCEAAGSGKKGAIQDADIASFRFVMVESDTLPIAVQLSLYAKIELPLAAIITSGGDSAHAWFKIDAKDAKEYEATVKRIYDKLGPLGFDKANKNPSRLSRLPGVVRQLGGKDGGQQRLLFLDPKPKPLDWDAFEASINPIAGLILGSELMDRVTELFREKPEAFTLDFLKGKRPEDGFRFRDGEVTIWSGLSGDGKSSMLATMMVGLVSANIPFFVCSMEIKPEKLCSTLAHIIYSLPPNEERTKKFIQYFGTRFCFADLTNVAPKQLIELMVAARKRIGCQHFIIDSLMRISGLAEPADQNDFVCKLQEVSKSTMGHVHLVAHPRKHDVIERTRLVDVKGSNDLTNNADNVVMVRRNLEKKRMQEEGTLTLEASLAMHDAEFYVEKQRETGDLPMIKLKYDKHTKTYEPFTPPAPEYKSNPHEKYYKK